MNHSKTCLRSHREMNSGTNFLKSGQSLTFWKRRTLKLRFKCPWPAGRSLGSSYCKTIFQLLHSVIIEWSKLLTPYLLSPTRPRGQNYSKVLSTVKLKTIKPPHKNYLNEFLNRRKAHKLSPSWRILARSHRLEYANSTLKRITSWRSRKAIRTFHLNSRSKRTRTKLTPTGDK